MFEFRIVVQNGNAKSYSLWTFNNYDSAYYKLLELIEDKKHCVKNSYYVLNSFYQNEFPPFFNDLTKFSIEVREVTKWTLYDEVKTKKDFSKKIINLF